MSVLEHAEQNDRRQVVGLIKRAQLANQMRQRRKQKNQHKENGMTMEEFLHREEKAKETMVELLQVCFCATAHARVHTYHHRSCAICALRKKDVVMAGIYDGGLNSCGCVSFLPEGYFSSLSTVTCCCSFMC